MKREGNKERIKFGKLNVDFLVTPDGDLHFFITIPYLVSCVTVAIDVYWYKNSSITNEII